MKLASQIISILALGLSFSISAYGQAPVAAPAAQPDQISQLAKIVGLSEEQEAEIRAIIAEQEPKIEALQVEAQGVQGELMELIGPDFDEKAIRAKATELGTLEGKMTAESILLQSRVDAVFTEEQRNTLEEMQRQQQMQQQMQQQQMQRQIQQQMQQMQQQQQQQQSAPAPAE